MLESLIEWTNHTGGPWLGCAPVSPGCVNCYSWELTETRLEKILRSAYQKAEFADWETRPVWGRTATRVITRGFWNDARRLNAQHAKAGTRGKWFPSLIDWLDDIPGGIIDQRGTHWPTSLVLADFLSLIRETPHLDWQLLTKRPRNFRTRLHQALGDNRSTLEFEGWLSRWLDGEAPENVWVGVSVEDQDRADERIPALLNIPAKVRFLSCEPLLGPVDISWAMPWTREVRAKVDGIGDPSLRGLTSRMLDRDDSAPMVHWVICGGESGPGARPMHPDWARSLRDQCTAAKVPFFFKQWGEWGMPTPAAGCDCTRENPRTMLCEYSDGRVPEVLHRVGKKPAGRLLDGREWNEYPESGKARQD